MEKEKVLYEYGERAAYPVGLKKLFHAVVLLALAAGMTVWALYSLFVLAAEHGFLASFSSCADGLFATVVVLAVCAMALVPLFRRQRGRGRRFAIYPDRTVVFSGKCFEINHCDVVRVRLEKSASGCSPTFETADGKSVYAGFALPSDGALYLKKIFGERVIVARVQEQKIPCMRIVLVLAAVVFAVGIAVTAVGGAIGNFSLSLTGAVFLAGGCIAACVSFERVLFVKEVLLPLAFGVLFFCFPTALGAVFALAEGGAFTFSAFFADFCFSGFYCIWVFMTVLGAYFIVGACYYLVSYLRYVGIK